MKRRLLPCFGVPAESFSMPRDYDVKKRKREAQQKRDELKRQEGVANAAAAAKAQGSVAKRTRGNDVQVEALRFCILRDSLRCRLLKIRVV